MDGQLKVRDGTEADWRILKNTEGFLMPKIFIYKVGAECLRDTIFGVEIVCVL